ncbi:hypothetical protein E0L36_15230 [Streptomyces sp. AJS327]|uniref:YrhK family protein n=1 Tax=Streptomyces sp. AJS327 TaxID=2545265 RepID=UPI0015DFA38D|nr:YrhK family protein [Streptomyces sp. AJS327]MBA0052206.1 hypothetical protein [Streptomyces sp. AJS327]
MDQENASTAASRHHDEALTLRVGREELVLRQRYEVVSVVNDLLIAVWFLVGSLLFLAPHGTRAGTWFFVAGSLELMVRPVIRFSRQVHLRRLRSQLPDGGPPRDASQDY